MDTPIDKQLELQNEINELTGIIKKCKPKPKLNTNLSSPSDVKPKEEITKPDDNKTPSPIPRGRRKKIEPPKDNINEVIVKLNENLTKLNKI
jgi:hypothetical protein